jgi:hypothetical protein
VRPFFTPENVETLYERNQVILSVTLVMRARHSPLRLILLLRATFFPHRLEQAQIPTAIM